MGVDQFDIALVARLRVIGHERCHCADFRHFYRVRIVLLHAFGNLTYEPPALPKPLRTTSIVGGYLPGFTSATSPRTAIGFLTNPYP